MSSSDASRDALKRLIEEGAFVRGEDEPIVSRSSKKIKHDGWLFDIRRISMRSDALHHIGNIFWDTFRTTYPFQIGGLESSAIPLVTALVVRAASEKNDDTASGFFIRKSRKKDGLLRMIEGEIQPRVPIILVDDLINSGKSLIRQVEVLEGIGYSVKTIWTIIRFHDLDYYTYFNERGIELRSIFTLDDFADTLGTHNFKPQERESKQQPYTIKWKFSAGNPSYYHVVPKSDPAIDDLRVYVGSDDGIMWALDQQTGDVVWSHQISFHQKGKGIFSSPALLNETVYFGGYDGNLWALDAATGKKKWVYLDADWIGSSPAVAEDIGLVFVGLEFGLWRKRGGIAAVDLQTGKARWTYRAMPCFSPSSPLSL